MKQSILNRIATALESVKREVADEATEATPQVEATASEEATQVSLAQAMIDGVAIEAEEFAVGQAVFAVNEEGERMPLEAGNYVTDEGNAFSVDEEGRIASIGAEAEEVAEEVEDQEMNTEAEPQAKKVVESQTVSKETFFSAIEELKTELKAEFTKTIEAKDAEIEALKTELSAAPSEVPTKVAPVEKKPESVWPRAKGTNSRTTKDRIYDKLASSVWTKN